MTRMTRGRPAGAGCTPITIARTTAVAAAAGLAVALAGTAAPLAAQEETREPEARRDTFALPEVVVTATRVPLHRDALPTPVSVLTGEELRERGIRTVAEALREVPGAAVVRAGPPGAQTSLFLRGGESDYVKVLVDGVPVNEPGGAIDFADLTTDQVERIEVVRGPVSVLYGSDAVSGVVQIFTRRGRGEPKLAVTATGGRGRRTLDDGAYGAFDAEATLSGAAGALDYSVGGGRSWSAGVYPFNNARALNLGTARVGWSPRAGSEVAVSTRYSGSESGFPTDGAGNLVDTNAMLDRELWTTSVEAGHRLSDRVDARVSFGVASRRQVALDRPDDAADTLGVYASEMTTAVDRRHVDARVNAELPRTVLTAGVALEWADADVAYSSESEWGPTEAAASHERATRGAYTQLLLAPVDAVDLTLGGRIDDSDTFGTFRTYRIGASWRLPWGTRLRGAIGRGFREPTFGESFGSGFGDLGNPALAPERSLSREVGLEHEVAAGVRLGATWFDQRFRDLIQFTFAPPEPGDPNYFNVGAALARGAELTAEAARGRVAVSGSYTYLETEVVDPGLATDASFVEGQPLLRRPRHTGSVGARYRLDRGVLALTVHATGAREDLDFGAGFPAPRVRLRSYGVVDLAAEHDITLRVGPSVRALLRVDNVTDAVYEPVRGFPAPGRLLHIGVRVVTGGS